MPAFKASPFGAFLSGFKAPVLGLAGLLVPDLLFRGLTEAPGYLPENFSELSFSFSEARNPKTPEQFSLQKIFSSGLQINEPGNVINDFQLLLTSDSFNPMGVTRLEYADQIKEQLLNPNHKIFQGRRATCGATNIQSALARFNPDLFVKISVGIAVSKDAVFRLDLDGRDSIEFLIPPDCFKPDDSRRDAVSRVLQSCLMEYLNGDDFNYSNESNFHYDKDGAGGKGVTSEATAALMSRLFGMKFNAKKTPLGIDLMQEISEMPLHQPVFVTLNWRRLSESELQERYVKIGGNREQYLSEKGYLGHMLSLVSIDAEQVTLTTTWSPYMHGKFSEQSILGRETTPEGRYDPESGLISMKREVFDSRVKMIIFPETSNFAKN